MIATQEAEPPEPVQLQEEGGGDDPRDENDTVEASTDEEILDVLDDETGGATLDTADTQGSPGSPQTPPTPETATAQTADLPTAPPTAR